MTEPIVVSDVALDELEASRTFETFYEAEARTSRTVDLERGDFERLLGRLGGARRRREVGRRW